VSNKTCVTYSFGELRKTIFLISFMLCLTVKLFPQSEEYMMKAVAFEKISLFISWPVNPSENPASQEFVISVLGQNPFGKILEEVYRDKKIKDKKVKINYIASIQNLTECDILFIPKIKISELQKVIEHIKGLPVLTVSDTQGFAEKGCFINFYQFENKLRFEINQKRLQDAGFIVDYRLLRVSKVLNPVIE
jgi:hypothetical protein